MKFFTRISNTIGKLSHPTTRIPCNYVVYVCALLNLYVYVPQESFATGLAIYLIIAGFYVAMIAIIKRYTKEHPEYELFAVGEFKKPSNQEVFKDRLSQSNKHTEPTLDAVWVLKSYFYSIMRRLEISNDNFERQTKNLFKYFNLFNAMLIFIFPAVMMILFDWFVVMGLLLSSGLLFLEFVDNEVIKEFS